MGTPEFAVPTLAALCASAHQVVAVYTAPPRPAHRGQHETISPVHHFAREHGIAVHTPTTLKTAEAQAEFKAIGADAAVVAAYGLLLPPAILAGTRLGCLNVHPSLLPRWRGAAPIQRTILAGDRQTGIVIMQMNEGLDTGDMLVVRRYDIADGTTSGQLHDRLAPAAGSLALEALEGVENGGIRPVPQAEDGVAYAKKILKSEAAIDWNMPAADVRQKILGLSPAPGASFMHAGEAIKILDAELAGGKAQVQAGAVLDAGLTIACGSGAIRPLMLQRPGKKPLATAEFLRGFPLPPGTILKSCPASN